MKYMLLLMINYVISNNRLEYILFKRNIYNILILRRRKIMSTLDEQTEKVSAEKALRYPLMKIKDSLKEIREISEKAQDYITVLDPEVIRPNRWEVIPQLTFYFIEGILKYLDERKSTDVAEVYLHIGNLMTVSIEYAETPGANKEGTLNPKVIIGSDLRMETKEYDDDISIDQMEILKANNGEHLPIQFFDNMKVIEEVCSLIKPRIYPETGIKLGNAWGLIPLCSVAFLRCAKDWLIKHKDDGPCGVDLKLGELLMFGIVKEGPDDDVEYYTYISPGQSFKLDNSKGDDRTEKETK